MSPQRNIIPVKSRTVIHQHWDALSENFWGFGLFMKVWSFHLQAHLTCRVPERVILLVAYETCLMRMIKLFQDQILLGNVHFRSRFEKNGAVRRWGNPKLPLIPEADKIYYTEILVNAAKSDRKSQVITITINSNHKLQKWKRLKLLFLLLWLVCMSFINLPYSVGFILV